MKTNTNNSKSNLYFNYLDILRGVAALFILIYHYKNLYYKCGGIPYSTEIKPIYPFYSILKTIYDNGHFSVQLFWLLSGFVFTSVYLQRNTTSFEFFLNRFSRLYPLHFISLLTVCLLQIISMYFLNSFQLFDNNDIFHLILNFFMIYSWGFETGYSFNGPIWSVSVEIFSYIIFFISLSFLKKYLLKFSVSMVILFLFLNYNSHFLSDRLSECAYYFYLGVTAFLTLSILRKHIYTILIISLLTIVISIYFSYNTSINRFLLSLFFFSLVLFIATLDYLKIAYKIALKLKILGTLSFSVYLWHVPLQMFILIIFDRYSINRQLFNNPWILILFVITTYLIAIISYYFIENPLRIFIKKKFI